MREARRERRGNRGERREGEERGDRTEGGDEIERRARGAIKRKEMDNTERRDTERGERGE